MLASDRAAMLAPYDGSIAIVQWTHTLAMKPMLLAARSQISVAPWAEHHIVFSTCGNNNASRCNELLEGAAPLVENVTCATASDVARDVPAFADVRSTFHGKRFKNAAPSTMAVGAYRWCWNGCDGPYVHWFKRIGQTLTHVRFFWFLEWDVAWTGNIASILRTWNSLSPDEDADIITPMNRQALHASSNVSRSDSTPPLVDYDLLCADPSYANFKWTHRQKRDEKLVPDNVTYHCVTNTFRITPRLLRAVVSFSEQRRAAKS